MIESLQLVQLLINAAWQTTLNNKTFKDYYELKNQSGLVQSSIFSFQNESVGCFVCYAIFIQLNSLKNLIYY